ncbi:MAG: DsbA family protein [Candidatus Rokubacteria bacterium]|nr:DsbA family protein [Candidatus Rokubacteria bacterium]
MKFYFDPACPWCYQTARWARRLEELGEIDLTWGVFSLEVVNLPAGKDPRELEARSGPALRTAIALRDREGPKAIGAFYAALGKRIWENPPPPDDMVAAVREALEVSGLDPGIADRALGEPATWDAVLAEHRKLVDETRSFGVPTIVLDGGDGPAIFGPVISALPSDEDAIALWRHTSWLVRYGNFAELKRDRLGRPDLPTVAWRSAQQAKKAEGSG